MILVPAWDSILLKAAVYYDAFRVLEIAFQSGTIYCYFDVPAKTYQELLQAESKGRFSIPTFGVASTTSRSILADKPRSNNGFYRPIRPHARAELDQFPLQKPCGISLSGCGFRWIHCSRGTQKTRTPG